VDAKFGIDDGHTVRSYAARSCKVAREVVGMYRANNWSDPEIAGGQANGAAQWSRAFVYESRQRLVVQIRPNAGEVKLDFDAHLREMPSGTNPGKKKQLGGPNGTSRQNHLTASRGYTSENDAVAVLKACADAVVDEETPGYRISDDVKVGAVAARRPSR